MPKPRSSAPKPPKPRSDGGSTRRSTARSPRRLPEPAPARGPEAPRDDPDSIDSATAAAIVDIASHPSPPEVAQQALLESAPDDARPTLDASEDRPERDQGPGGDETPDERHAIADAEAVMADYRDFVPGEREAPSAAQIAERAYFFYERRGRVPGHELEDWYAAERELRGGAFRPEPGLDREPER